ncbi:ABC transporter substrate-binding protein, partial [Clostridiaceae bacterium HSG29]|nr:ABC transporter substrate-binding protein [Clostridiaceae bacterium HSG29]
FDLFNAILLNVYKKYGEDGIKRLGKSLLSSMHPSEMVKSHINIVHYISEYSTIDTNLTKTKF